MVFWEKSFWGEMKCYLASNKMENLMGNSGACSIQALLRLVFKRFGGGHWGILETAKPKKKSSKTAKPQKNSAKTENRIQNRQEPIQWWQVGHTEQTKLTLISPKYLWMSWTLSEAFVSFCVCLNHRLCFCRSLEPRLCGSISEKPLVMEPS